MWKLILSLPKIFDVLEAILVLIEKVVDYVITEKENKEIEDALNQDDRKQAASDLDDVFNS